MDYKNLLSEFQTYNEWNQIIKKQQEQEEWDSWESELYIQKPKDDRVNSPSHYTSGRTEVIDVIEDAVKDAPDPVSGVLQGNVLKYILRCWLKDSSSEDLKKAKWYLTRLIQYQVAKENSK